MRALGKETICRVPTSATRQTDLAFDPAVLSFSLARLTHSLTLLSHSPAPPPTSLPPSPPFACPVAALARPAAAAHLPAAAVHLHAASTPGQLDFDSIQGAPRRKGPFGSLCGRSGPRAPGGGVACSEPDRSRGGLRQARGSVPRVCPPPDLPASPYSCRAHRQINECYTSRLTKLEFGLGHIVDSVEATVISVQVIHGSWLPKMTMVCKMEKVFTPQEMGTHFEILNVGDCKLKVTVAWSLFSLHPKLIPSHWLSV
ncbi:hypothetical protein PR202_ga20086 [Eleusine coracana subsp. coracana]|uniref:Uncharacterized protein n=1 Tax=Eleusine coracana subsp. coracana TaxID=191504 RepID=A0AAV5CXU4_ELECO|nr:hypothetical protein PR202_ga20086 [Eleusine coracana subsp. coracana]